MHTQYYLASSDCYLGLRSVHSEVTPMLKILCLRSILKFNGKSCKYKTSSIEIL